MLKSGIAWGWLCLSNVHSPLLAYHIGACLSRLIETTLDFFNYSIYTILQNNYSVPMLLLLKLKVTINKMVLALLQHNIRWSGLPPLLMRWISSFTSYGTTNLCLPGYYTDVFLVTLAFLIVHNCYQSFVYFILLNLSISVTTQTLPAFEIG
jgi:hypothetical protein